MSFGTLLIFITRTRHENRIFPSMLRMPPKGMSSYRRNAFDGRSVAAIWCFVLLYERRCVTQRTGGSKICNFRVVFRVCTSSYRHGRIVVRMIEWGKNGRVRVPYECHIVSLLLSYRIIHSNLALLLFVFFDTQPLVVAFVASWHPSTTRVTPATVVLALGSAH